MKVLEVNRPNRAARRLKGKYDPSEQVYGHAWSAIAPPTDFDFGSWRCMEGGGLKDRCHLLQALALATGLEHRFTEPGLSQGQSGLRRSPGHR